MKKIIVALMLFVVLVPFQAMGQQWKMDPVHTNFYFDVKHTYATVRGQFMDFSGDVFFDPDNPGKSKFNFVIQVDSIDTKVGKRDIDLRSPNFFDATDYPVITFRSNKVTRGEGNVYLVQGKLTIKDVSKDVTLKFLYHGQKENPLNRGQIVAGLDTELTIDRLEFHVGNGSYYQRWCRVHV